ncbi:MAG: hypothetical protein WAV20_04310, partial [Blastocatellia bacterium]
GNSLRHLFNVTFKIFRADLVLVVIALIGFVMFGVQRLRERLKGMGVQNAADLFRDAIVLAPLVYLAACLVRFNAGPYLIPFLPFIGLFFGWFVVESVRILKAGPIIGDKAAARNVDWLQTGVLVMLITVAAVRAVAYQFEPIPKLREQDKRFEAVSNLLSGPDTIYVHGTTEILVLLNKPNATPYVFLDWGKDDYLAAMKFGGSFEAIIDELESVAPKIVSLSRLQRVAHRDEIRRWVEQHYEAIEMTGYDVYIRKQGPSLIAQ